jgi:stalled ribosome rescue protein Dom34
MIDDYVETDPNSFYTYEEFQKALYTSSGSTLSIIEFVELIFTSHKEIYDVIGKHESQIIVAGPGHTKSRLREYIKNKNSKLNILAVKIQNIDNSALNELFTKKEVYKFFENSILFKEENLLNLFLENLGKNNGKSIYGLVDIKKSILQGACESILVSEKLWKTNIDEIQNLIKNAEKIKANVHIVEEKSKKNIHAINSFGGIIANLRFKI